MPGPGPAPAHGGAGEDGAGAPRAAAHVVVADLRSLVLDPDDARHLSAVLRLRPGEVVGATDGRGGYRRCVYDAGGLSAAGEVEVAAPRRPVLTIGFVPVKGDRPEWTVQKLTELGVDRIVVVSSERGVVRWDGPRAVSHVARLQRVARSAVMQSRQVWMPDVSGTVALDDFVDPAGPGPGGAGPGGGGVAVADMGGGPIGPGVHALLVGPEGGWSPGERALFEARALPMVGLGPSVLRAETAAVAGGVLMAALRAGLVGPAAPPAGDR